MKGKRKEHASFIRRAFVMRKCLFVFLMMCVLMLSGCASRAAGKPENTPKTEEQNIPILPEKLAVNDQGIPVVKVFEMDEETITEMDLESYLMGVVAGEMKNDWPMEALKAQAILARTFVLKFCDEKESKYPGADISTDIEEAQAFDATAINERIEQAVKETEGMVLSFKGELPYAWFHAHSGGMTAKAQEGLNYEKDEPGYTKVTAGLESPSAPEEAKTWEAVFTENEMLAAVRACGLKNIRKLKMICISRIFILSTLWLKILMNFLIYSQCVMKMRLKKFLQTNMHSSLSVAKRKPVMTLKKAQRALKPGLICPVKMLCSSAFLITITGRLTLTEYRHLSTK